MGEKIPVMPIKLKELLDKEASRRPEVNAVEFKRKFKGRTASARWNRKERERVKLVGLLKSGCFNERQLARMALMNETIQVLTEGIPLTGSEQEQQAFFKKWQATVERAAIAKHGTVELALQKGSESKKKTTPDEA
jgi:DNA polymerase III alpha subunit